jgi:hypothetical protein
VVGSEVVDSDIEVLDIDFGLVYVASIGLDTFILDGELSEGDSDLFELQFDLVEVLFGDALEHERWHWVMVYRLGALRGGLGRGVLSAMCALFIAHIALLQASAFPMSAPPRQIDRFAPKHSTL